MLNLKQEHKVGVVVGLIASILFTYFLQPIFDWVSGVVVKVLTIASSAYLDRIYAQAASLQTQDFAFLWISLVFGSFAVAFGGEGIARLVGKDRLHALFDYIFKGTITEPSLIYRVTSGLLLIFLSLLLVVVLSANYMQLRAISSFQQHMRTLAPFISAAEEKQLYSRWSLIRSHDDYESVYIIIDRNRIVLGKRL